MRSFRRALDYLPQCRRDLALGLIAVPLARGFDVYIPILIGEGIDDLTAVAGTDGSLSRPLSFYFFAIVGLALLKGVAKFAMRHYIVGASRRFEFAFRNDLYAHLLRLPPTYFQSMRTGDVMSRLSSDVEAVRMFLGPGAMYVAETFLFLTPAVIVLSRMDPVLAALTVLPLGLILWAMIHYATPIHDETVKAQERLAEMTNDAQEQFAGVRVIRAFGAEPRAIERFEGSSTRYRDQSVIAARLRGLNWVVMIGAKDLGMVALIAAGAVQLIRGSVTLGEYFVFNLYLGMLFWPMVALGWIVAMYQRAKASMERLEALLSSKPAVEDAEDAYSPSRVSGRIEFRDFRFAYPSAAGSEPSREVLRGIDLVIEPGTILGVTGGTGSGKSTLLAAIARLVDVPRGTLFVDGVDVTRWRCETLRRAIGFVSQDAFLFADTLRSNLALAKDDVAEDDLRDALSRSQFELEPSTFPKGLDTLLGERGVTLSGGQRQRATIARALVRDPAILLLDDCLSAVDADTEARILSELRVALEGRTAILVSHRVAALEIADRVVVLDDGVITAEGTPEELRRRGGRYRDLHERQRMEAELEAM